MWFDEVVAYRDCTTNFKMGPFHCFLFMLLLLGRDTHAATYGDIRLVGGNDDSEGRVEVYLTEVWSSVCDDGFGILDASVVCRQLGRGDAETFFTAGHFGKGIGQIALDEVNCQGGESRLIDCPANSIFDTDCIHQEDVGVRCSVSDGDLRLAEHAQSSPNEGRLEIFYQGMWGTICDDNWDINDVNVACRQLGFAMGSFLQHFEKGTGPILLDDVNCVGNEGRLIDCSVGEWFLHDCTHAEDVGIICSYDEASLRLVGGPNELEGRVEIFINGEWGTICDDGWDITDADIACRHLGLGYAIASVGNAYYGEGSGKIVLSEVNCQGDETRIVDCILQGYFVHHCDHSEDVGIRCTRGPGGPSSGALRLVEGSTPDEGRLEVYWINEWGTVCDDMFDMNDARVACLQLGHSTVLQTYTMAHFGVGSASILLDELECEGTEQRILECPRKAIGNNDCTHDEDAGVRCGVKDQTVDDVSGIIPDVCNVGDLRLVGGSTSFDGYLEVCNNKGIWGAVCNGILREAATVVCEQVAGEGVQSFLTRIPQTGITGDPVVESIRCTGTESSLSFCSVDYGSPQCSAVAWLDCRSDSGVDLPDDRGRCTSGDVQLSYIGVVEICINSVWSSICSITWDSDDALVVCQQLGYGEVGYFSDIEMDGSLPPGISRIECTGMETELAACPHTLFFNTGNCERVATLTCENDTNAVKYSGISAGGIFLIILLVCCYCWSKSKDDN